tara:strand:- start:1144 stop:1569 length:426 start_codon:yes stop_codon:yes gene_type:complete
VLINELAIGTAPKNSSDLNYIENENIISILSLCSEQEANLANDIGKRFNHSRIYLPDHRTGIFPEKDQIKKVLKKLDEFMRNGAVLVHCVAAMERSPLICMAWLITKNNLDLYEALEYMMQIHPGTSPLPEQLRLLNDLNF